MLWHRTKVKFSTARLLNFKSLDQGITGNTCTVSKIQFDHFLLECFIKVYFWINKALCGPHTSILQNNFCSSNSTQVLKMNNEWGGSGQGTLSQSLAKVWAIIITVCTQSGCVLSYSLSQSSEETREFGTDFPRGQDNPNIQYLHACNPSLYFHWRDKTRCRHGNRGVTVLITVVLITLRSSMAIKLKGDHVWEWKWLSH